MALTTLYGTVQLALQEALAKQVQPGSANPAVPNFALVSIRRDRFVADNRGEIEGEKLRFRRDLDSAVRSFLSANGWRIGGSGNLVLNLLLRAIPQDCTVQVRTVTDLYRLDIVDGSGPRSAAVRGTRVTVGRAHDANPRGFIPVNDPARLVSREHLSLLYEDLIVTGQLLGRNPTTLNGASMSGDRVPLHNGDRIACGDVTITIQGLG